MTSPLDLAEKVREACAEVVGGARGGCLSPNEVRSLDLAAIVAEWERGQPKEGPQERGSIVAWLLSQAFERRFSPKDAEQWKAAAESIRAGEHYTDTGHPDPRPRMYTEAEVMTMLAKAAESAGTLGYRISPREVNSIASRILAAKDGGR